MADSCAVEDADERPRGTEERREEIARCRYPKRSFAPRANAA
jgi:hypothetical protein